MKNNQKKYYRVWTSESYKSEIYDNCYARLSVRGDGNRARVRVDTTYWRGNTGGFAQRDYYYDGRDAVRSLIRNLRLQQIRAIKLGDGRKAWYIGFNLISDPRY